VTAAIGSKHTTGSPGAVGNLIVAIVKSLVAQRFTEGGLDDRLAGGKTFVVERQMAHRRRLDQPLIARHVR
jgi:hypothetical protein